MQETHLQANQLQAFFQNKIILAGILSGAAAQLIKVLITWWVDKKFDWRRCFGMGGMPSSHSAFVFSAALMCGLQEGFASAAFAVSEGGGVSPFMASTLS